MRHTIDSGSFKGSKPAGSVDTDESGEGDFAGFLFDACADISEQCAH